MLQLDSIAPGFAAVSETSSTPPTAPLGGTSNAFSSLYRSLSSDIHEFIETGSTGGSTSTSASDALVRRAMIKGAGQTDGGSDPATQAFIKSISPLAQEVGGRLGVSPDIIAAQAALESGWGKRPLRDSRGADVYNLFGIKAGGGWTGETVQSPTTEYERGTPLARNESFRAYPNEAAAFQDFAQLLLGNARYRGALNTGNDVHAYAEGLRRGGYATDPDYGEKLARTVSRIQSSKD